METPNNIELLMKAGVLGLYGIDGNHFVVRVDGRRRVFEVVEDESDGYRSSMDDLREVTETEELEKLVVSRRAIAKVRLREAAQKNEYQKDTVWELVGVNDDHVWLRFGTANWDDYYPYFVFEFFPQGPRS